MSTQSEAADQPKQASSHMRMSAATDLYVRFAAAEAVVLRRLKQIETVDVALRATGIAPPPRAAIHPPHTPSIPSQFNTDAMRRRERSVKIVTKAIARLKAGKCKSTSPSKAEVIAMSRHREVDPEGIGVSKNVFRTNQDCLDIFLSACLPFDAERRRQMTTPSWALRIDRARLIALVLATESDRDQLTRDLMAANELLIAPTVAALRKAVVQAKAQRMLTLTD